MTVDPGPTPPAPAPPAPAPEVGRPRPARKGYLVPGAIALVVLAGLGALFNYTVLIHHDPPNLAGPDVARAISQAIQAAHPSRQPPQVSCPTVSPLRAGYRFDCSLRTSGPTRAVHVVETTAGRFTFTIAPGG